ncbi:hypothetical protein [Streptomyces viridosporus]|uniref:Uncharacterized protein n=1 Tax=Streptomyces viridosporus T7A TaxID=665577 RepID=A0ABX6ADQ1_STRVD|nr:hypothetical protein [Streptomyces viridosporus]QEU85411.1 hypothetical protein CP969_12265 [Streptomyces viridosporus T7A]
MTSTSRSGEVGEREGSAGVTRLRRRPEAMLFAPFSRRAPTARLRQVAVARGALPVRHRARGQIEDDGRCAEAQAAEAQWT